MTHRRAFHRHPIVETTSGQFCLFLAPSRSHLRYPRQLSQWQPLGVASPDPRKIFFVKNLVKPVRSWKSPELPQSNVLAACKSHDMLIRAA
jgi:hypothetical protein